MSTVQLIDLSGYALCCLIEALHEDRSDGVPHAEQNLELCRRELRRLNAASDSGYAEMHQRMFSLDTSQAYSMVEFESGDRDEN